MFLPVESYRWDWEEDEYKFKEIEINPSHIESIETDDTFGDHTYAVFKSGQEMIIAMSIEEFKALCTNWEIRTLLS